MVKVSTSRRTGRSTVTFSVPADIHDGSISVVGDFNGWEPGATTLVRRWNRTRSAKVELDPGRYEFRYLGEGGAWLDGDDVDDRAGDNVVLVVP